MLKRDLIAALARRQPAFLIRDVDQMVDLVFDSLIQALDRGENIELRGFGSFHLREYRPRTARNPGTGQTVTLGARRGVRFRPGLFFKKGFHDGH
jgi:integration host factor subunit beta